MYLTYKEASRKHKAQFFGGQDYDKTKSRIPYIFPFGKRYIDERFVTVSIPVNLMNAKYSRLHLVDVYAENFLNNEDMEPVWLSIGRKLKNGDINMKWTSRFSILDGNHRTLAARKAGLKEITAIMPQSHYVFYLKNRSRLCPVEL